MGNLKNIAFLVLILLLGFCVYRGLSRKEPKEEVKTVTVIKTIPGDSIAYPVKVYLPSARDSIIFIRDTTLKIISVDTARILERYFARYLYNDTIRDSSFVAILKEIVTQNKIVNRQLAVQNLRAKAITYITNTTSIDPIPKWYIGPSLSYNGKIGLGVGGIWCNKNHAIGASFDVTNRITTISYQFALKPK